MTELSVRTDHVDTTHEMTPEQKAQVVGRMKLFTPLKTMAVDRLTYSLPIVAANVLLQDVMGGRADFPLDHLDAMTDEQFHSFSDQLAHALHLDWAAVRMERDGSALQIRIDTERALRALADQGINFNGSSNYLTAKSPS